MMLQGRWQILGVSSGSRHLLALVVISTRNLVLALPVN